jgi:uncharacterized membrane protein YgdD (TMEM256/DUF423 family)
MRLLACFAALCGFLLVAAAAGGAHLMSRAAANAPEAAEQIRIAWERAVSFGLMHLAPLLIAALGLAHSRLAQAAAAAFLAGVALFSGVQLTRLALEALALAGDGAVVDATAARERPLAWAGALVPVGGISLHLGWLLLAASIWTSRSGPLSRAAR